MEIRFREKADRSGVGQLPEAGEYLRSIGLQLIDRATRDGKRNFDLRVLANQLQQQRVGRQVALTGYTPDDLLIELVIEVASVVADVKEPKRAQPFWLMHLKIEDEIFRIFRADN